MSGRSARAVQYLNKAEESRIIAEGMNDERARQFLMNVAADYIMLARMVERLDDPIPASEDFKL